MPAASDVRPLLEVAGLVRDYGGTRRPWSRRERLRGLGPVDLTLAAGATLALVGESGSGKSTLARLVAGLDRPTAGEVRLGGRRLASLGAAGRRALAGVVQLVFQDSAAALNPRLTAVDVVAEPLLVQGRGSRRERRLRALAWMERVGLTPALADRRAPELSGGQRQRLAIARALTLEPELLVLDEALAGLDLSVQAQVVNLLLDLQEGLGLAYLFITHDLAVAGYLAHRIAVLDRGRVVEVGRPEEIFGAPRSPATRALLAVVPPASGRPEGG